MLKVVCQGQSKRKKTLTFIHSAGCPHSMLWSLPWSLPGNNLHNDMEESTLNHWQE
jgi:hypothetical protein